MERTLAIIKPDAVQRQLVGVIISEIEINNFAIPAITTLRLTPGQAALFYQEHRAKPFYDSLVAYMASGQLYALVLEKEDAVEEWRQLMGPTDPAQGGAADAAPALRHRCAAKQRPWRRFAGDGVTGDQFFLWRGGMKSFQIRSKIVNGVAVLYLKGHLDAHQVARFEKELVRMITREQFQHPDQRPGAELHHVGRHGHHHGLH